MMKKDIPQKVAGVLAHIHPLTTFLKNAIA
jgi:hypothetical protein